MVNRYHLPRRKESQKSVQLPTRQKMELKELPAARNFEGQCFQLKSLRGEVSLSEETVNL